MMNVAIRQEDKVKEIDVTSKCKERLDNGTCLGCNRLELYEFTGDDNCPLFRDEQIKINEKGEIK